LIDRLNGMLRDDNPTVVASALAALMDIWERSESIKLTIDYASASKLVQILPDCSECVILPMMNPIYAETNDHSDGVRPTY
jgi:AP-2 complex subunit beta-1